MYGDVFVTKSVLDPRYDMNIRVGYWNNGEKQWEEEGVQSTGSVPMLRAEGREYIGIGECSNQLFLVYKPTDIAIGSEK